MDRSGDVETFFLHPWGIKKIAALRANFFTTLPHLLNTPPGKIPAQVPRGLPKTVKFLLGYRRDRCSKVTYCHVEELFWQSSVFITPPRTSKLSDPEE